MSIKYNSVADIPEDLKWIVEQDCPDTAFYQREGDEALFADSVYSSELHGLMPIWTRKAVIAAKECLARCEGINIRNSDEALKELKVYPEGEAVKWDDGLPPIGAECDVDVFGNVYEYKIEAYSTDMKAVLLSSDGRFNIELVCHCDFMPLKNEPEHLMNVGSKFEFKRSDVSFRMNWIGVKLLYKDDQLVVLEHLGSGNHFSERLSGMEFRPLKTEAELAAEKAAEERENAVNFVTDIIRRADKGYAVDTLRDSDLAEYIVDATGYRIKRSE